MPRVSIVIPTYNRAALLEQTLDAVAAQSLRDYEVIVVDDGSTDRTREMVARRDVTLIALAHGGRPERCRNAAFAVARGELIALLDDDDLWAPDYLERQLERFDREPSIGLCYCDVRYLYPDGTLSAPRLEPEHRDGGRLLDHLLDGLSLFPSMLIFRRALLARCGPIAEYIPSRGDHEFLLRIAYHARAVCTPIPLVTLRRDPGGVAASLGLIHYFSAIDNFERFLATHPLDPRRRLLARRALARFDTHLGLALLATGAPARARRRFVRSLRRWPLQRTAWRALAGSVHRRGTGQRVTSARP